MKLRRLRLVSGKSMATSTMDVESCHWSVPHASWRLVSVVMLYQASWVTSSAPASGAPTRCRVRGGVLLGAGCSLRFPQTRILGVAGGAIGASGGSISTGIWEPLECCGLELEEVDGWGSLCPWCHSSRVGTCEVTSSNSFPPRPSVNLVKVHGALFSVSSCKCSRSSSRCVAGLSCSGQHLINRRPRITQTALLGRRLPSGSRWVSVAKILAGPKKQPVFCCWLVWYFPDTCFLQ